VVTLEQVEKLREKADIPYHEAKAALEKTNGDMLEAIINLEKERRIPGPEGGGYFRTRAQQPSAGSGGDRRGWEETRADGSASFMELVGRFFRWCGKIIEKGNRNSFEINKDGNGVMAFPVTVLAVLLIFIFWIVVPLIILGLFFGYRYRFAGPDLGKERVNQAFDSAARAVEDLKREIKDNNGKPGRENPDN